MEMDAGTGEEGALGTTRGETSDQDDVVLCILSYEGVMLERATTKIPEG